MERGSTQGSQLAGDVGYAPRTLRVFLLENHQIRTAGPWRLHGMLDGQKTQQHAAVWGNRNFHTGPNIDHSWVIFGKHSPSQLSGLKIALFCRYPLVI